jgi:hypothetical protein
MAGFFLGGVGRWESWLETDWRAARTCEVPNFFGKKI